MLVDQSSSLYFGIPGQRYIDQINYAAASIAKAAVAVGDSVGLIMTGTGRERRFRPSSGDRAFYQILEILADSTQSPRPPGGEYKPELLDLAIALCNDHYPEWLDEKIHNAYVTFLRLRPSSRRRMRDRLKLASVITEYYSLGINETAALRYDDQVLAEYLRRFLTDHGQAWVPPLAELAHRRSPREELISGGASMARQLNLSIAHSHDNEVYVLFAHLFDLIPGYGHVELAGDNNYPLLEQLIPAIKVAVGRHHRVVVLSPTSAICNAGRFRMDRPLNDSADVLRRAERIRLERYSQQISRRLRSIGANFALLGQPDVLPLVMSEAELAGSGRFTRRGYR